MLETHAMNREEVVSLAQDHYTALIRLDEASLALVDMLKWIREDWEDDMPLGVIGPLDRIARQIRDAIPEEIKAARPGGCEEANDA